MFCSNDTKCTLWTLEKSLNNPYFYITFIILFLNVLCSFSGTNRLVFVLHKDVLFFSDAGYYNILLIYLDFWWVRCLSFEEEKRTENFTSMYWPVRWSLSEDSNKDLMRLAICSQYYKALFVAINTKSTANQEPISRTNLRHEQKR